MRAPYPEDVEDAARTLDRRVLSVEHAACEPQY